MQQTINPWHLLGLLVLGVLLVISGWAPFDRAVWWLEVLPILIAIPIVIATYQRYRLTHLLYGLIFLHVIVLLIGAHYSYARVPIGYTLADLLHITRNPYDKIGHLMQGILPAMVAREIFLRGDYVHGKKMFVFIILCIALAISAAYELFEWWAAVLLDQKAEVFLAMQGDPWDTQSDMLMALIGAAFALLFLSRWHDRELHRLRAN